MPPLKPRQDIPVPDPTLPSGGGEAPRDANAADHAVATSARVTCMRRASDRNESSHSATIGMMTSSATCGHRSMLSSHAAS